MLAMKETGPMARLHGALSWLDGRELVACQRFNAAVRQAGMLRLFRIASRAGDGVLWYALIAALALFFGPEGRVEALRSAFAGLVGLLLYRGLKGVLVRERPFITHRSIVCAARPLDRFSFPSGHTLHAVTFTILISAAVPGAIVLLAPVALLIALSRVVLGLHYPSDVLAGAVLGAGIATAALSIS
jgi:undecaprenyl-diphosphatase